MDKRFESVCNTVMSVLVLVGMALLVFGLVNGEAIVAVLGIWGILYGLSELFFQGVLSITVAAVLLLLWTAVSERLLPTACTGNGIADENPVAMLLFLLAILPLSFSIFRTVKQRRDTAALRAECLRKAEKRRSEAYREKEAARWKRTASETTMTENASERAAKQYAEPEERTAA